MFHILIRQGFTLTAFFISIGICLRKYLLIDFCIGNWFGQFCQYYLDKPLDKTILFQFGEKASFSDVEVSLQSAPLTCYTGIPRCNSAICLDWRQICDNRHDCENGEDEPPMECFRLELNECDPVQEYRCRNGMCIPRSFFIDFYYDCMDQSDEQSLHDLPILNENCFFQPDSHCEEFSSYIKYFSCGDGQSIDIRHMNDGQQYCHSGRNRIYAESVQSFHLSNLSYDCWFIMSCLVYFNMDDCDLFECDPYDDFTDCFYVYEEMIGY